MSDCYPTYLAYRRLGCKHVPAVVMGVFPAEKMVVERTGGAELLPPLIVTEAEDYSNAPDELQDWLVERRLRAPGVSKSVAHLTAVFIQFAELIQSASVRERVLHDYILEHPEILDVYGCRFSSDVQLKKKTKRQYVPDLIIQYPGLDRRTLFVELERASKRVFNSKGRPSEAVVHACQQVEDWMRWWQENPSEVPEPFDSTILPEGLVIVGRSAGWDADTRARLLHLNQNRRVKVITYDDLLDRVEALIVRLEEQCAS
jgi:hypothetical protein